MALAAALVLAVRRGGDGGFDHFPELRILLERFVLFHFEAGTEEKIFEGMTAEDAVDDDAEFVSFEVNAVIADAKAVKDAAGAFEFTELIEFGMHDLLWQSAKFAEDLQLQFLGHLRQFGGAGRIKNDLKRAHFERLRVGG